jgi:hypothetical protein
MWKKVCYGFVPVGCLVLGLLAAGAVSGQGEAKKPEAKKVEAKKPAAMLLENCDGMPMVCPVFYWGFFAGYYQYMGYKCDEHTTVGLSSTYPLSVCNCEQPGCLEKCIEIGSFKMLDPMKAAAKPVAGKAGKGKRLGESIHYHHDYLEAGIEPKKKALADAEVMKPGSGFTAKVEKPRILARLYRDSAGTKPTTVALHTIQVKPDDQTKYDTKIFASGYEVLDEAPTVIIPKNKIKTRNGKALLVTHDGHDYLVVLGRETEDPE